MASKILETIFWQKAKPERKYGPGHEEGPYTIQNTGDVSKMIKRTLEHSVMQEV